MAVAIILLLVAVGSVLFHIFSPWWWTPIATNWRYIDDTINITFWITGAVFFAVIAFMVSVPVLSLLMTVVPPSVSTSLSDFTTALSSARCCAPDDNIV